MTSNAPGRPHGVTRRAALALGAGAASAAKTSSTAVTLCVTKSGPEKGSVRFAGPGAKCKKGEQALEVLTGIPQGVLGVSFNFSPERHSGVSGVVVAQIKDGKVVLVK